MRSCNCNCNTEHYIVRPNIPTYDWSYEYNTDSNAKRCKCDDNMELLIDSINAIRNNVSSLQDIMRNNNPSGINTAVIENRLKALEDKINEVDTIIGSDDHTDILNRLTALENAAKGIVSPTEINEIVERINTIDAKLESLLSPEQIAEILSRISALEANGGGLLAEGHTVTIEDTTLVITHFSGQMENDHDVDIDGQTLMIIGK